MMNAYPELYVNEAMENLGEAFHHAVDVMGVDPGEFLEAFLSSDVSVGFSIGTPKYMVGMSGTELAELVLGKKHGGVLPLMFDRSPAYWVGWSLAYFQWYKNVSFSYIFRYVRIQELLDLYNPLHEADLSSFVDLLSAILKERDSVSRVKEYRTKVGMTQRELSEASGVKVRTIQQYENKSKDIRKASGEILKALSRTLHCRMEDLVEGVS